ADMYVRHKKVVVADSRIAATALRSAMDVHVFPKNIVPANGQKSFFTFELEVLGRQADRAKGIKLIVFANYCGPFNNNVGFKTAAIPDADTRTNTAVRADGYIRADFRLRTHNRSRMNHGC